MALGMGFFRFENGAEPTSGILGAAGSADTGTLPAVSDPSMTGHFTPAETDKTGPDGNYTIIAPKELGEGLREIADPELRHCLESLAAQIGASSGPPSLSTDSDYPIPAINRSI